MTEELLRTLERVYFEVLWGEYAKEHEFEKARKHYREVVTAIVDEIERDHLIIDKLTVERWARDEQQSEFRRHMARVQS